MIIAPLRSRAPGPRRSRGQTVVLAVVSLLVLALIVFITFNVTVAVQQRIKLQNYADAKAFSMAVAEARTLNYLAYTNRAIAASYVGMANIHAYMSEAAMLADLKVSGATIMGAIAGQEYDLCNCCCTPFGCAPCCFEHCIDGFEATMNALGLTIDWISGDMGGKLSQLDGPASQVVSALDAHITSLRASQVAAKAAVGTMLARGSFGSLKENNMQLAASATSELTAVDAFNALQWTNAFDGRDTVKKQLMAEAVNASRQDFAWNRSGPDGAPITPMLFPQLSSRVKSSNIWMGPDGTWTITQTPDIGFMAGGRTGFADSGFGTAFTEDVSTGTSGSVVSSFDWGTLNGAWKHGASTSLLPITGPIFPGKLTSGSSDEHTGGLLGDIFNNPHDGSNHSQSMDMSRFEEFKIGTSFPYNQPSVYSAVTTDTRVNEYGKRGPWEVATDGSGTVSVTGVGSQDAKLTLSNNEPAKAISKAMVYYHRIGDWSDDPNLFNPYWRAKLQPVTQAELLQVLAPVDTNASEVAGQVSRVNGGAVNVK